MAHPIICTFMKTHRASFPLILVIGREPNTKKKITNRVGRYDFREHPHVAFWNISYAVVAGTKGETGHKLKKRCEKRGVSPIIYADALPIGIKSKMRNKNSVRAQLNEEDIQRHVNRVFSHHDIINRVRLVIMSGLEESVFEPAPTAIKEQCKERNIRVAQVRFFCGNNKKKIEEQLDEDTRRKIRKVLTEFKRQPQV